MHPSLEKNHKDTNDLRDIINLIRLPVCVCRCTCLYINFDQIIDEYT